MNIKITKNGVTVEIDGLSKDEALALMREATAPKTSPGPGHKRLPPLRELMDDFEEWLGKRGHRDAPVPAYQPPWAVPMGLYETKIMRGGS